MARILVTRPEPGGAETEARLMALGHAVVRDPMLVVEDTGTPLPAGRFDAIAFTSLNGVRAFSRMREGDGAAWTGVPAFAVGSRTAAEARRQGFADITDCAGEVEALAARLAARLPPSSRVLHAAGAERAGDLAGRLAPAGIAVETAILYRTVPAAALAPHSRAALAAGTLDTALHFSPRTVAALRDAAAAAGLTPAVLALRHLCLSEAVAAPLRALGSAPEIADAPNEDALLALLTFP